QNRRFRAQTREPDRAQGLQPDLVKRGGEIIGPRAAAEFAKALGEGDRELAAGAERLDRVAQLLDLGEPERITVDMGIEAPHSRIFGGALDRIEKAAHRLFAAGEQLAHLVLARTFDEVAAELGGQDDRFGQGRPARRDAPDRDPAAKDHERGDNPDRGGGCYIKDTRGGGKMDDKTRTELEAATFRALVAHLRERTDVQNIDLMNLAGFCRNCLSKWYRAAAEEKGVALSDPDAREI